MSRVLRALLARIVDYAGLFPPAALEMRSAVANYAAYRGGDDAWMLGRFVVAASGLPSFAGAQSDLALEPGHPWALSVVIGPQVEDDVDRARAFNAAHAASAIIQSLEVRTASPEDIRRAAAASSAGFEVFAEIALEAGAEGYEPMIDAVRAEGVKAKVRTGGTTPGSTPSAESLARFVHSCIDRGVPFKATAGLHHPLRSEFRMTYAADAPVGVMFGYLNVFLAAAFMKHGLTERETIRLLEERDPSAFDFAPDEIRWRGYTLTTEQVVAARQRVAVSFGSCSFREPVDELRSVVPKS